MAEEDRITGRTSNVRQLFIGRRYTIDAYQREYSWATKHVEDLVNDLSQRFLAQWDPMHERREVQHYPSYFLGPIITTADERINLIDGQQRLTTLTLLLIFLRRLQEGRDDAVADLGPLIYSRLYGEEAFTLDIVDRRRAMTAILHGIDLDLKRVSPSERTMLARYRDIEESFPEDLRGEALPFFVDWLLGRVVVIEIIAHGAATGQEIFETMNDRGQRLTSLDMLKSYLIGRARRSAPEVHEAWRAAVVPLEELDPDAPTDLVKHWLGAKYAQNAADDEAIETAMHQWLRRHDKMLGLHRPADYRDFVTRDIHQVAGRYRQLLSAAGRLTPGLEPVFYNAYNKLTAQLPLILSTVRLDDSDEEFVAKARMVAGFLDIYAARSIVSYQDFRQAAGLRRILELTRVLRRLDRDGMAARLGAELDLLVPGFGDAEAFGLRLRNRAQVRYLLARITAWLEQQCGVPHDFAWYAAGNGQAYEIEHLLANKPETHPWLFGKAFAELRNRFGALVLLPKSTNAGFGAMPYDRKLPLYSGQNLLARSLHPGCYERNPVFMRFVAESGLPFRPYPDRFDEPAAAERQRLYLRLAARVWDPAVVGLAAPELTAAPPATHLPRQRIRSPITLADLLRVGALQPGRLVGEHQQVEYVAELTPRGTVRLASGVEFASPSAAAMTALDKPSWNGWTFWAVPHPDGSRTRLDVIRHATVSLTQAA
jgi:hypothetical protein